MTKTIIVYAIDVILIALILSLVNFISYGLIFWIMALCLPFVIDNYIRARNCYLYNR